MFLVLYFSGFPISSPRCWSVATLLFTLLSPSSSSSSLYVLLVLLVLLLVCCLNPFIEVTRCGGVALPLIVTLLSLPPLHLTPSLYSTCLSLLCCSSVSFVLQAPGAAWASERQRSLILLQVSELIILTCPYLPSLPPSPPSLPSLLELILTCHSWLSFPLTSLFFIDGVFYLCLFAFVLIGAFILFSSLPHGVTVDFCRL